MKDTTNVLPGIKKILTERWPESLSLLEKITQKAQTDFNYAQSLNTWLRRGSTSELRALCVGFGDYHVSGSESLFFTNQVNSIDTAHHLHYQDACKIGNNQIIESIRDTLIERWPESETLLNQMIDKASDDELYSKKLKSYFSRFGETSGSTLLLRELTSSFGHYFAQGSEGLAFQNNVDAIDAAHLIVGQEIPTLAELGG